MGNDGSRQCRSVAASFVQVCFEQVHWFIVGEKGNGKLQGSAIHVQISILSIYPGTL
jgi:hypothetical protein